MSTIRNPSACGSLLRDNRWDLCVERDDLLIFGGITSPRRDLGHDHRTIRDGGVDLIDQGAEPAWRVGEILVLVDVAQPNHYQNHIGLGRRQPSAQNLGNLSDTSAPIARVIRVHLAWRSLLEWPDKVDVEAVQQIPQSQPIPGFK